ncbi:MAG: hypothetical protein JWO19_350 [Bryobacterales bacterium]|nr:hypothetical protein [Bryobacterales bacterium]
MQPGYNHLSVRAFAKSWALLLLGLASGGLSLAATTHDLPSPFDSPRVSGWVLADLDGDQNVDLATASSGRHDDSGYAQEVRITLGAFQSTSFHFRSRGATVELSSRDVDGDRDGDLIVFEPLSGQPIGVWINDGAGSFHEGRLADFQKLWSAQPGSAWRVRFPRLAWFAISEDRTQSLTPAVAIAPPERTVTDRTWQNEAARRDARRSDFRPRAPPCNS